MKLLAKSFNKKIDSKGLALFRIFYCFFLLIEIKNFLYFEPLMFDDIPFIKQGELDMYIAIIAWFISVVFVMFGAFTRVFTILNYILTISLLSCLHTYEYHVHPVYQGINFLMMFMPVSANFSIDLLRKKIKYSDHNFKFQPVKMVSQFYYWIVPYVAIALVYFDSIFIKFTQDVWLTGMGVWRPASITMFSNLDITFALNQQWLMYTLGYLTLIFETVFIFLFYFKKFRLLFFIIGVGLHLGIAMAFPIPLFGFTYLAIYLLLVPIWIWNKIFKPAKSTPIWKFTYNGKNKVALRWALILEHFDWFSKIEFSSDESALDYQIKSLNQNKTKSGLSALIKALLITPPLFLIGLIGSIPGIKQIVNFIYKKVSTTENIGQANEPLPIFKSDEETKVFSNLTLHQIKYRLFQFIILALTTSQALFIYDSPVGEIIRETTKVRYSRLDYNLVDISRSLKPFIQRTTGVKEHHVFVDNHYVRYNHAIAVTYTDKKGDEIWLPLTEKDGRPGDYAFGPNWAKYCFRLNGPGDLKMSRVQDGLMDFTAFWAYKNNVDLKNGAIFNVKVKVVESPDMWVKDFIQKQKDKPWHDAGEVIWKDNEVSYTISKIETIE